MAAAAAFRGPGFIFFFQAEDGIRDFCLSRGLGTTKSRELIASSEVADLLLDLRLLLATSDADLEASPLN